MKKFLPGIVEHFELVEEFTNGPLCQPLWCHPDSSKLEAEKINEITAIILIQQQLSVICHFDCQVRRGTLRSNYYENVTTVEYRQICLFHDKSCNKWNWCTIFLTFFHFFSKFLCNKIQIPVGLVQQSIYIDAIDI